MRPTVATLIFALLCAACSDQSASPQQEAALGAAGPTAMTSPAAVGGKAGSAASAGAGLGSSGAGASARAAQPNTAAGAVTPSVARAPTSGAGAAISGASGTSGAAISSAGTGALAGAAGAAGASVTGPMNSAAGAAAQQSVMVGHPHRFIASVHGGNADKLVYVDVDDAKKNWELDVSDGIQDFQLIGNNKLLVGYKFNFGYLEVDLASHQVDVKVRDFLTREQAILTSVKRLPNGHTLIMGQGLVDDGSLEVWEVDNTKMVHNKRTFKGCCGNLRVVRLTAEGHFLVGSDSALVELDDAGKEVARLTTGGSPTYMGLKTADGTYYATNGHGGQLVAFAAGGQRRVVGGRGSPSAQKVTIYQPGQFQILQNGNVVTTNWTAENGGMGQQLVEYDRDGNMVWSWDDPAVRPQGMETLIVLDNLDPAVVNDDRDGVLKPVP